MTEKLQDKELTDIKYLRARMTGNVGLALDHAYNLGFFDGEKNIVDKIKADIEKKIVKRPWLDFEDRERDRNDAFLEVLDIIDKYRTESEDSE